MPLVPAIYSDGKRGTDDLTTNSHSEFPTDAPGETARLRDGECLHQALRASAAWFEQHVQAVNSLNVFPVPDGDTGTNMMLTLQSALKEVGDSPSSSASEVAQKISHGALMGARGNSGVILSQLLRGMARYFQKKDVFTTSDLAAAMREGAATAYKGVLKPVEGTILTVAREVADACARAAEDTDDVIAILETAVEEAHGSVSRTPSLLPVLKEAGVVDAGGQGLAIILEGVLRFARGESVGTSRASTAHTELTVHQMEDEYGYDTQFIIHGEELDVEMVRQKIAEMGDSVMVVGDSSTVKVHVHTPTPGTPLNYGASLGSVSHVIIEDMQQQYQEFLRSQVKPPVSAEEICNIATVVVAPGAGLQRVFESLGASSVVSGGQTMNPSTEELLNAIEKAKADSVIVLPNNRNVILSAQQAKALSTKGVFVIPTRTVPEGIAALLAFNYQADATTNAQIMEQAHKYVQTVEVTRAVRSARVNGLSVTEGEVIGLLNGEMKASGDDFHAVVLQALGMIQLDEKEIVTLYYGADANRSAAEELARKITEQFEHLEVEIVNGGQPHYPYILSVE
jgi:DAK2 domain fusion protein YloV